MSTINHKHVKYSSTSYTNLRGSGYGWLNRFFSNEEHLGQEFIPLFKTEVVKLRSRDRVKSVAEALKKTTQAGLAEWTNEEFQDLNEAHTFAVQLYMGLYSEDWGFRIASEAEFKSQLSELVGVSRALCLLYYNAGLRMEDFAYEVNHFSRVKDGVIEIRSPKKNQSRTLNDENRWGLSVEDCEEVVVLITEKLQSTEAALVRDELFPFSKGWKFRPSELRATHGINLIKEGLTWDEAARIQGVGTTSFKKRCKEYLAAQ